MFEDVLVSRLTSYLQRNKIIDSNQYGLQKGKSINKLLGNFANILNINLSRNVHSLVLFLDFSKAFDTIPHQGLIDSLENIGIRGDCIELFKNYLSCRSFVVKIKDKFSAPCDIYYGVPQGSKLGPILYLIFANNLLRNIDSTNIFAYADDIAIVVSNYNVDTAVSKMQKNLDIVSRWCHGDGLVMNISKTKIMHVRSDHFPEHNFHLFNKKPCPRNKELSQLKLGKVAKYRVAQMRLSYVNHNCARLFLWGYLNDYADGLESERSLVV